MVAADRCGANHGEGGVLPEHRAGAFALRHRCGRRRADTSAARSRSPAPMSNTSGRIRRGNISTWCRATAARAPSRAPSTSPPRSASIRRPARSRTHGATAALPSRPVHCSVDRGALSADRLQLSEQHHGPSHRGGRHDRRASAAARKARRRHFRPSGADHAGQPQRHHGHARQQSRRRQARGPRRAQGLWLQGRRAEQPRFGRSRGNGLGFGPRHLDFHPSRALAVRSRSSARASFTSTSSTPTARSPRRRCSSRTRSPTAPTTATRRWPAPSTSIRTAASST